MKITGNILSFLIATCSLFIMSCGEDRTYEYLEITKENQWIYSEMKTRYLWADSIKPLQKKNFFGNSQTFFKNILYKSDKTSYFTGAEPSTSYGMSYVAMRDPLGIKASDTYALVVAVEEESPADKAGVKRGTWISKCGKHTISLSNNPFLQQGDSTILYTKRIDFNDETATYEWHEGDTLKMGPSTVVNSTAIALDTIYSVRDKKVGYIVCNRFDGDDFVQNIQSILSQFHEESINELILDLRYNSGGSLKSAVAVAGMLLPADKNGSLFSQLTYSIEDGTEQQEYVVSTNSTIPNLDGIYILSTGATRGVAESFISGMKSLDNRVRIVGNATMGDNLYTEEIESPYGFSINPVVARLYSTNGVVLPEGGIYTDYLVDEFSQIQIIYPLGDQQEYMLYSTIHLLTTGTVPQTELPVLQKSHIQFIPQEKSILK